MKIAANRVGSFVEKPDAKARVLVVFGPDGGQVQEVAARLARSVVPDLNDPFRVAELTPAVLKADPARLSDEAAAMSLTGGRRVVRIRDADESLVPLLKAFLANPVGDALIVLAAGDLGSRSALRKLAEEAANAAALSCYRDEAGGLGAVIRETLGGFGLTAEPDAMAYLTEHLGGDRLLTRRELERLALFAMGAGRVTVDDAIACIGDGSAISMEELAFATADGDHAAADRLLDRLMREGTSPVGIVRGVMSHFQRLHLVSGAMVAGRTAEQAMAMLRPPVFYKRTQRFRAQLRAWPPDRAAQALEMLTAAEIDCKSTGLPDKQICGRVLLQIGRAAAAARARAGGR